MFMFPLKSLAREGLKMVFILTQWVCNDVAKHLVCGFYLRTQVHSHNNLKPCGEIDANAARN